MFPTHHRNLTKRPSPPPRPGGAATQSSPLRAQEVPRQRHPPPRRALTHRSGPRPSFAVRTSKKRALCRWFCSAEPTTPMEETSSWAQGSADPPSTMGSPLRTVTFTRCRQRWHRQSPPPRLPGPRRRPPGPRAHLRRFTQDVGGGGAQLLGQPRRQPSGRQAGVQLQERHGASAQRSAAANRLCPPGPARAPPRPRSGPGSGAPAGAGTGTGSGGLAPSPRLPGPPAGTRRASRRPSTRLLPRTGPGGRGWCWVFSVLPRFAGAGFRAFCFLRCALVGYVRETVRAKYVISLNGRVRRALRWSLLPVGSHFWSPRRTLPRLSARGGLRMEEQ